VVNAPAAKPNPSRKLNATAEEAAEKGVAIVIPSGARNLLPVKIKKKQIPRSNMALGMICFRVFPQLVKP
jgi:hypothetical protein